MKTVFITGGTTGIGLELAKYYLNQGWRVGVCGRDPQKFEVSFNPKPDHLEFYHVDVANRDELKKAVNSFSKLFGLDLMIANAGIGYKNKTKWPDFDMSYRMVHVNLLGVMYSAEASLEIMRGQGRGHLAIISSIAGYNGLPGVSAYSATKAAVLKFAESLHLDMKSFGIDVTAICPGFVDTPLTQQNHHPMPFLMPAPKAARLIARAIEKKKMIYAFPFFFSSIVRILSVIPRTWYKKMMTLKMANYSKEK